MFKRIGFISLLTSCLILSANTAKAEFKVKLSPSLVQIQTENENWQKLIQHIAKHGKIMDADIYSYLYIENTKLGENGKDRHSEYLSLVGVVDSDGVFNASHLEGVSETWTNNIQNNNWNIDQWLFKVDGNSNLKWAAHIDMIQTVDHQVLKHDYVQESQSSLNTQWQSKLKSWYEFINK
jgi:hypothetical protein